MADGQYRTPRSGPVITYLEKLFAADQIALLATVTAERPLTWFQPDHSEQSRTGLARGARIMSFDSIGVKINIPNDAPQSSTGKKDEYRTKTPVGCSTDHAFACPLKTRETHCDLTTTLGPSTNLHLKTSAVSR